MAGSSVSGPRPTARRSSSCAATPSARRTPTRTRTSGRAPTSFRDNLTLSFDEGGPPRPEGRRRVLLPAEPGVPLQPLHGHLRRPGRRRSRPTSSRCSRCGTTSRPGTWRRSRRSSAATRSASARCSSTRRCTPSRAGSRTTGRSASRLTLNLGVRYDLEDGVYAEDVELEPFLKAGRPNDTNNWAPRARRGLQPRPTRPCCAAAPAGSSPIPDRTPPTGRKLGAYALHPQILNDGRRRLRRQPVQRPDPDLRAGGGDAVHGGAGRRTACGAASARSPRPTTRSPTATRRRSACSGSSARRCRSRPTTSTPASRAQNVTRSTSTSPTTRRPASNYPFTNISQAAVSGLGLGDNRLSIGESNYHGLQMAFTKRMSDRWQASATYLLAGQWNLQNAPVPRRLRVPDHAERRGPAGVRRAGRPAPDDREEWYLHRRPAPPRHLQRHLGRRLRLPGERPVPLRRQRLGDADLGRRRAADRRAAPAASAPTARSSRATASTCPSLPPHGHARCRSASASAGRKVDGIVEVFNVFNHANYGSFVLNESNARYGQPTENLNVAYQPRHAAARIPRHLLSRGSSQRGPVCIAAPERTPEDRTMSSERASLRRHVVALVVASAPACTSQAAGRSSIEEATIAGVHRGHPAGPHHLPRRRAGLPQSRQGLQRRRATTWSRRTARRFPQPPGQVRAGAPLTFPTKTVAIGTLLPELRSSTPGRRSSSAGWRRPPPIRTCSSSTG